MIFLITGIVVASFFLVAIITRNASSHNKNILMEATVINTQTQYGWKEGERWQRSAWGGELEREKTWQMYYVITVKGIQPETKRLCTFYHTVWADELDKVPAKGNLVQVLVDARHPERYSIDLHPLYAFDSVPPR